MAYSNHYMINRSSEKLFLKGKRKRIEHKSKDKRKVLKWRKVTGNEEGIDFVEKSNTYIINEENKIYIDPQHRIKIIDQFDLKKPKLGQSFLVKEMAIDRKIIIEIAQSNDFSYQDHIYLKQESPLAVAVCNIDIGEHVTVDKKDYEIIEY